MFRCNLFRECNRFLLTHGMCVCAFLPIRALGKGLLSLLHAVNKLNIHTFFVVDTSNIGMALVYHNIACDTETIMKFHPK